MKRDDELETEITKVETQMTTYVESMKKELDLILFAFKMDLKNVKKDIIEYKHFFNIIISGFHLLCF